MNERTIDLILKLNHQFYQKTAKSFDLTRQSSSPGWKHLLPWLDRFETPLVVLDIGCGNGRFGEFLIASGRRINRYIGLDGSKQLLATAKKRLEKIDCEFHEVEISRMEKINVHANLVVAMAFIHHIPSAKLRTDFIKQIGRWIKPKGILVISFWQWIGEKRLSQKIIPWPKELIGSLENNDYLLDWQKSGIPRYCHSFETGEIDGLKMMAGFNLVMDYESDGKSGNLNRYLGWQKKGV